jgi:hypothetical protein
MSRASVFVLMRFVIRDETCEAHIGYDGHKFNFDITKPASAEEVFQHILLMQNEFFEMRKKAPIGFGIPQ